MDVSPIAAAGRQIIEAYRPGLFRVSGVDHTSSVIVTPEATHAWDPRPISELSVEDFAAILQAEPPIDVLLIGCGLRMALLPTQLRNDLRASRIAADAMDTGAACRTYNVLVSEHRRVAAALIAL